MYPYNIISHCMRVGPHMEIIFVAAGGPMHADNIISRYMRVGPHMQIILFLAAHNGNIISSYFMLWRM